MCRHTLEESIKQTCMGEPLGRSGVRVQIVLGVTKGGEALTAARSPSGAHGRPMAGGRLAGCLRLERVISVLEKSAHGRTMAAWPAYGKVPCS